jgi:hypothetical protein
MIKSVKGQEKNENKIKTIVVNGLLTKMDIPWRH